MTESTDHAWIVFQLQRKLSARRFEELCMALLEAEGHRDIRHVGAAGGDLGIDILSTAPDGRIWATQCKRYRTLSTKDVRSDLQNAIDQPPSPPPAVYRVVAPCDISRRTEAALQEMAADAPYPLELARSWAESELVRLLLRHPKTRSEFIAPAGPLPFWNVPNRTEYFVGRAGVLQELSTRMTEAGSAALTQAITGLGGIGKTQVAITFCRLHRWDYEDGVFWLDGSSGPSLLAGYAELAVALGLVGIEVAAQDAAAAFRRHLASRPRWLVVIDNADQPDDIRQLLPPDTGGHVLVTTRHRKSGIGKALEVDLLPIDEATELLLERGGRNEEESPDAAALAAALDRLPLALEQAGAYLAHHAVSIAAYLDSFEARRLDLVEKYPPEQGGYHATVATTWEISFNQVAESSPAATAALEACGYLAPDGIPLDLFRSSGGHLGEALEAIAAEEDPLILEERLIEPLTRYALARYDPDDRTFSVHRLVQLVIRTRLRREEREEEIFSNTHAALDQCFPRTSQDPSSWEEAGRWLEHVQAGLRFWTDLERTWNPTTLWLWAANYAKAAGRAAEARVLETAALEVRRRVLGEEHPDTLISMNNLAATLSALGDAQGARDLDESALEVRRRVLGEEHPYTLMSMNNLAETLFALGDAQGARDLHAAALEVRRRVLGEEHPSTLSSMNNLAATLFALGDAQGARDLHEAALEVYRRVLGEEHPSTLNSMNNLAETLRVLGDTQGARDLHKAALEVSRRVLGEEHPSTLSSMNNLAATLFSLGDAQGARDLHEAALEVRRRVLGEEHPDTLTSMNNLALTLNALGDAQGARDLHDSALEVSRRVLGEEHPDTLMSMNNLALTLNALGDGQGARDLHKAALEVYRRVLGEEHPHTLTSLHNLLVTQAELGDVEQALVEKLLASVARLPEKTPIRVAAEKRWGSATEQKDGD